MSYRIEDEPRPGALGHLVVHPVWPLFAVMFGGAVLSWPWFVLNGVAVGSPTRRTEVLWAAGGFAGSFAIALGLFSLAAAEVLSGLGLRYALVGVTVWKLLVSYWIFTVQGRSFHLHEHFGGQVKSGMIVVVAGYFLLRKLFAALPAFWILVLR